MNTPAEALPDCHPDREFTVEVVTDPDRLESLGPAWSDLVERTDSATVFQSFEWNACWWQVFGKQDQLLLISCFQGEELVGLAPLSIGRGKREYGFLGPELRFIGCRNKTSDYLDFIVDPRYPGVLEILLETVLEYLEQVPRIRLSHFPAASSNQEGVLAFLRKKYVRFAVVEEQRAPYRRLGNADEDRKAVNNATSRRRFNHFRKSGELNFHKLTSPEEIETQLDRFFEQHVGRRALAGEPSQFRDPDQRDFYRILAPALLTRGWLRFDRVVLDEEPIAYHFGCEFRNRFIWYKPSFDARLAKHSPGTVLMKFLVEDAVEHGLEEFDFTVGSEPFKYRYANGERCNNRIVIFRSGIACLAYRTVHWLMQSARRIRHDARNRPLRFNDHKTERT
jgi:CelD/BcsL family acetyltransferase involved in cellulose biosynthesis